MKNLLFFLAVISMALAGCQTSAPSSKDLENQQAIIKGDIDTDICQAITADFVYSATGKPVVKVEPDWILPGQACRYYFTYDPNFNSKYEDPKLRAGGQLIFMMVENLSVENQKKGLEILDSSYKSESRIKMENMVTYRENGTLRDIRLIINPNRYVRIDTNLAGQGISDEELIQFAIKVAEKIQGKLSFEIKKNPVEIEEPAVAKPTEPQQQVVEDFWNNLAGKNIEAALKMMDANEGTKQAWGVNFNNLESLSVKKIEPTFQEEWTSTRQSFKVTLEVKIKPAGEEMGWQQGQNYRWISLQKNGEVWQIHELAGNP